VKAAYVRDSYLAQRLNRMPANATKLLRPISAENPVREKTNRGRLNILIPGATLPQVGWREPDSNRRRLSAYLSRSAAYSLSFQAFWGIALRFSRGASRNAPSATSLAENRLGLRWMTKPYVLGAFPGISCDFQTLPDVAGGLWSWDG
jgi:hypothetical protein